MKLIVAVNNHNCIGNGGKMMWRSSEDFKHFKQLTMGGILIVGSRTFENDLRGKGLPGRMCFVVGRNYLSLAEAVKRATVEQHLHPYGDGRDLRDIWIIGGKTIYEQLLPLVTEFHVSKINDWQTGDAYFHVPENHRAPIFEYFFEPNKV